MRYMLTGDKWGTDEAYRMGVVQEIAPNPTKALEARIELAQKIAACGPLGIKTTLESAHVSFDESEAAAFAKLNDQFGALFHTEDFIEGRRAEAEGRPPLYQGRWGTSERCDPGLLTRILKLRTRSRPRGVSR